MARDGTPYRGVLYAGLMLADAGPMVLEFNARFGDPEAQVLMPLLEGQLADALLGTAVGDRSAMEGSLALAAASAVGVVLASEGYPEAPLTGRRLEGADPASADNGGPRLCFHAATATSERGGYVATGGRVATFVGIGKDLETAAATAYAGIADAALEGGHYRSDIGAVEVAAGA
jgi:phosphoribosylamine--glycine ligase